MFRVFYLLLFIDFEIHSNLIRIRNLGSPESFTNKAMGIVANAIIKKKYLRQKQMEISLKYNLLIHAFVLIPLNCQPL